ncbi:MAG: hypothetical protein ACTHMY_13265 [Solirubrobacteraceae bacterium]
MATTANSRPAGTAYAFAYTAVQSGAAASMNVYVDSPSKATNLIAGIYSSRSGHPYTLLAYGQDPAPTAGQWNQVSLTSPTTLTAGQKYWIAILGTGGTLNFRDSAKGNCSQNNYQTNLNALPASFWGGTGYSACSLSAYATSASVTQAPVNSALPVVSGTAQQGSTLSVANGTWSNGPTSYGYQWQDCDASGSSCASISGATSSSYNLAATDVSHTVRALVSATNAGGTGQATSAATAAVAAPPAPPTPSAPTASFSYSPANPVTGQTVSFDGTASTCAAAPCSYSWADDPPTGGSWPLGAGSAITFKFTGVGTKYVTLSVTDGLGRTATVEHDLGVASGAPSNTAAPSVSGSAQVGQALTAAPGTWTGTPSYAYQWQDCDSTGSNCASIAGATAGTYTVASGDVNHTLEVAVTATNGSGTATASSPATAVVSDTTINSAPLVTGSPTQTLNCFASPGACGYPDPSYNGGNVGVSNCSALPAWTPTDLPSADYVKSGNQITITASGVTIQGYNVSGYFFYVDAPNFTLNGDCVTFDGSTWAGGQSSSTAVWGASPASGLTVENSTIQGANASTGSDETLITSGGAPNATIKNNVLQNAVEDINGIGTGSVVENNYVNANGNQAGSHAEDLFEADVAGVTIDHNTLLNPFDQSAVIFAQVNSSGAPCDNQFKITSNLIAGGGWPLMLCAHAGSVGTSAMTVQNNAFARCLGTSSYDAAIGGYYCGSTAPGTSGSAIGAGADSHGYWPGAGFFGMDAVDYWSSVGWASASNYWDDNGSSVNW